MGLIDICDTCAFCDACPSAHFHPDGKSDFCADYRTMLRTFQSTRPVRGVTHWHGCDYDSETDKCRWNPAEGEK